MLSPEKQGTLVCILTLINLFIFRHQSGEMMVYAGAFWSSVFTVVNPLLGIFENKFGAYIFKSMMILLAVVVLSAVMTEIFRRIFQSRISGESIAVYMFVMYYPLMILISFVIRWIRSILK